jgi:hypothetical protein
MLTAALSEIVGAPTISFFRAAKMLHVQHCSRTREPSA